MPPKGASQARKAQLDKARPHFLNCFDCKLKIKCPRYASNADELCIEPLEEQVANEGINMISVKEYLRNLSLSDKSEILAFLLNSESDTIWNDQKKAACNVSQSTDQTITEVNAYDWYEGRHLLIRTIAEELSKVLSSTLFVISSNSLHFRVQQREDMIRKGQ